jgi:outer membrane immunogenic protein
MQKKSLLLLAAALSVGMASAANAQANAEPYVGLSGGYHHLGINGLGDDDATLYGVVAGVDVPVGSKLKLGIEGNYHRGDNAIDSEYGIAARLAFPVGSTSQLFAKAGYQEVDFNLNNFVTPAVIGLDDTDGDYLVGVGGEFGLGSGPARIRLGVDSIAFDSLRATAGVIFKF